MLSGNGRHRRPRQVPAIVVAAGVTGSAIALPLMATGSASAADGSTWNHVADCESGGSWSANSGNGYYGGLQLTQQDWETYGGLKYADSADEASRSQQIAVAQRLLDDKGAAAFGTCAALTGLGTDRRDADVQTGVDDGNGSHGSSHGQGLWSGSGSSDDRDGSNGAGGSYGDGRGGFGQDNGSGQDEGSGRGDGNSDLLGMPGSSETPGSSATHGSSSGNADGSSSAPGHGPASQDPSASAGSGGDTGATGFPDVSSSPAAGNGQRGGDVYDYANDRPEVGVSGLVDTGALSGSGKHRGITAGDEGADPRALGASGRHAGDGTYTVRNGDSLASIADSLDVQGGWEHLYGLNKGAVGSDPSHITPGQTLRTDS